MKRPTLAICKHREGKTYFTCTRNERHTHAFIFIRQLFIRIILFLVFLYLKKNGGGHWSAKPAVPSVGIPVLPRVRREKLCKRVQDNKIFIYIWKIRCDQVLGWTFKHLERNLHGSHRCTGLDFVSNEGNPHLHRLRKFGCELIPWFVLILVKRYLKKRVTKGITITNNTYTKH